MNITKTSFGHQANYSQKLEVAASAPEEQQAPTETFSFSESNGVRTLAKLAGAGLGIAAGVYFTGFSQGTGGVANALVGGAGAGIATFSMTAGALDTSDDPIGASLAVLGGGTVAAIAGTTLGAMGYNFPLLVSGGLGIVGAQVAGAVADRLTGD